MKKFNSHPQWKQVESVYTKLVEAGFKAYLAGGCVRDLILSRTPQDFDVATDARPSEVEKLFPKSVNVGKQFGIIMIPGESGKNVEVATFRKDGEYKDGRHPESIEYGTPEEDAERRDFTINALFYDLENQKIIDYVGGEKDIGQQIIRTVGDPEKRFSEDYLRILRAIRFAGQLNFEIEFTTWKALQKLAPYLTKISQERVHDELLKLMQSQDREGALDLLRASGVLNVLFKNLSGSQRDFANYLTLLKKLPKAKTETRAFFYFLLQGQALFLAKPEELDTTLMELKLPRLVSQNTKSIFSLIKNGIENRRKGEVLDELMSESGLEYLHFKINANPIERTYYEEALAAVLELYKDGHKPKNWLNGEDCEAAGFKAGKRMGEVLQEAYYLQLEKQLPSRQAALDWLKKLATQEGVL